MDLRQATVGQHEAGGCRSVHRHDSVRRNRSACFCSTSVSPTAAAISVMTYRSACGPSLAIAVPTLLMGLAVQYHLALLLAFFATYLDFWGDGVH